MVSNMVSYIYEEVGEASDSIFYPLVDRNWPSGGSGPGDRSRASSSVATMGGGNS